MAIKMRNNTHEDAICCECGEGQDEVLNMYDICIGGMILTICDRCNEEVLNKTLRAVCARNSRTKSSRDLAILRRRGQIDYEARREARIESGIQRPDPHKDKKGKAK